MTNAHIPGQLKCALAIVEDFGSHTVAFALEELAACPADCNSAGILPPMLQVVERLVQFIGRQLAVRAGMQESEDAAHNGGALLHTSLTE